MLPLCFQEGDILASEINGFPVLFDKRLKGF